MVISRIKDAGNDQEIKLRDGVSDLKFTDKPPLLRGRQLWRSEMQITQYSDWDDHEMVLHCRDADVGLTAIIAVHSTLAGPAAGGIRMWPYATEDEALVDVLRLSRGMTYKNILAGLPLGGGKSVIIGDPRRDKTPALLRSFGRFIDALGGRYRAAEDVGISVEDIAVMATQTAYVAGRPEISGDPSPVTALGVYHGLKATAAEIFGSADLRDRVIAVQGLGHVGANLCRHLAAEGPTLIVADLDESRVAQAVLEFGAVAANPATIHASVCDIFAPCALGGVLSDAVLPQLRCKGIAGAANNQLDRPEMGALLAARGILYAPDYVINAGGIINVAAEISGHYDRAEAQTRAAAIGDTLRDIFAGARNSGKTPAEIADAMADERLSVLRGLRRKAA